MKNSDHEIFYTRPETVRTNYFILEAQDYQHAFRVLRKKIGDTVSAIDGEGRTFTGTIVRKLTGKRFECKIEKTVLRSGEPVTDVTIYLGLIKASRFETFIEKGVEIGVKKIVPLITERSFKEVSTHKLARWNSIAIAAMKQCRRSLLPEISAPVDFRDFAESTEKYDLRLIARKDKFSKNFSSLLKELITGSAGKIAIAIGPEGGFSGGEIELAEANGFLKVKFGERRLRAETAAIVALTTILFSRFDL